MSAITINLLDRGTLPLFLPPTATVLHVKQAVAQHIGKSPEHFLAVSQGQELQDYEQLCNIPGVYTGNSIHVVERQELKNECVEVETANGPLTLEVNQDETLDAVWSKIKTGSPSSDQGSGKKQKRGTYTKRACVHCRNAHAACDEGRPCKRCRTMGLQCIDAERKPRKKQNFSESATFESLADYIPALAALPSEERSSQTSPAVASNSLFNDQQQNSPSPFACTSSNSSTDHFDQPLANFSPQTVQQTSNTDDLLRQVVVENARQAQELVELRLLVRQLCQVLIGSGDQPQTQAQTQSKSVSSLIS